MRKKNERKIKILENYLKRLPKKGKWMKDIVEDINKERKGVKLSRTLLNYYLFGWRKGNKLVGGYFRDKIEVVEKQGNNKFIKWKG